MNARGDDLWLLVCGSTNPMQGRIANAVLRFRYADGQEEKLELVPPLNALAGSRHLMSVSVMNPK